MTRNIGTDKVDIGNHKAENCLLSGKAPTI